MAFVMKSLESRRQVRIKNNNLSERLTYMNAQLI